MRGVRDRKIAEFIRVVESRYPRTRVVLEPWGSEEDPDLRWLVWILNVPPRRIVEVEEFTDRYTLDLYDLGRKPIRFFAYAVSPENTAEYFPGLMTAPREWRLVVEEGEIHVLAPVRRARRRRAG